MAYLVEQFTGDRGIQLGNEDFIRQMPWGTNWQKIRVGCRVAVNGFTDVPSASLNLYPANPLIGVCTGYASHVSPDCVDVVYCQGISNYSAILVGSAPYQYYVLNNTSVNFNFYQKVGTSFYTLTYAGGTIRFSANPTTMRSPWYFDITKTVGSATQVECGLHSTNIPTLDYTRGDHLKAMETESAVTNCINTNIGPTALTRTNRDWNCVFVGWRHAVPTAVFYDISVVRFY